MKKPLPILNLSPIKPDKGRPFYQRRGFAHDWMAPITDLEERPGPHPPRLAMEVASYARDFVARWSDWAELAGMRPDHLVSNRDPLGRGLAWRCYSGFGLLCFPKRGYVIMEPLVGVTEDLFVYRFTTDGRCVLVTGAQRKTLIGSQVELGHAPPRYILAREEKEPGAHEVTGPSS